MTFFSHGFRPFFLGAGAYATLSVALWGAHLAGVLPLPGGAALGSVWHGHEMLFGFAAAALAGFLLTATPNWSGRPPLAGPPLVGLAALWFAGRVLMWLPPVLPAWVVAAVDGAFLPALLIAILPALVGNPKRQGVFVVILLLLTGSNGLYHGRALGWATADASLALWLGLDCFIVLLTVVGGRVVPSFTANALRQSGIDAPPRSFVWLERATVFATLLVLAFDATGQADLSGAAALAAAALHAVRLAGWQGGKSSAPIVWILHAGYLWIPIGLALKGLGGMGLDTGDAGLHALGAGAVGTMTLAVMSRAALGHTGRPLHAPPTIVAAYVLVLFAGAGRVATGLGLLPGSWGYAGAATAWAIGFGLFTITYLPMFFRPRADRPIP